MRFKQYLKEDIISKALSLKEPRRGDDISDEETEIAIDILNQAIDKVKDQLEKTSDEKQEALLAKLKDLEDKLEKYEKGIEEPERTVKDQPVDGEEPLPDEEPVD